MRFAHNSHKEKVKPEFSGQRAVCPLCGSEVIGKCGETYVWHWQHSYDRNCDPWKEHETDWHREWKGRFPEILQEVVIDNYGDKHRADIKTYKGLVIEFQHSSISPSTIRIREEFYENMIWVVDVAPFKQNLRKWSVVQRKLKRQEEEATSKLYAFERFYSDEINVIKKDIEEQERKLKSIFVSIENKKELLGKFNKDVLEIDEFSKNVILDWETNKWVWNTHTFYITDNLDKHYGKKLRGIPQEIKKFQSKRQELIQLIASVNELENISIGDMLFKIVPYHYLRPDNFHKARAIVRDTRTTFFPDIRHIKSEADLKNYQYLQNTFDFAIDPAQGLELLNNQIIEIDNSIELLQNSIPHLKDEIKQKLFETLKEEVSKLEAEITGLKADYKSNKEEEGILNKNLKSIEALTANYIETSTKELEKEQKEKRIKLMKENKGLYTFGWKYERTSWQAAECELYFDFGDGYLYEKIDNNYLIRVSVEEFVQRNIKQNVGR